MTRTEQFEAAVALRRCCEALGGAAPVNTAELATALGVIAADASGMVREGRVGARLVQCFELAEAASIEVSGVAIVRSIAMSLPAVGMPAKAIVQAVLRLCLVTDARLISATTFVSRADVDAVRARVTATFDAAADFAADALDQSTYRAITALHAAVVRDLSTRARPLPRIASYKLGVHMPALSLANRLYGDAGRSDELQAENKTPHPLFMPRDVRALTA